MSDLLGYLLRLDEPDERARVEARLRDDPDAERELAALRRLVEPLAADREAPEPPSDLVTRTIGLVAEHACRQAASVSPLELALFENPATGDPVRRTSPRDWTHVIASMDRGVVSTSRWRRADLAVVAAILMVGAGLILAALPHVRYRHGVQACKNQLREVYAGLDAYAGTHDGRFPAVTEDPPHNMASSFATILREAGTVPASGTFGCPMSVGPEPTTFAYTLGYRDEARVLSGLRRQVSSDLLPIAGDRPAMGRTTPNPDHRYGQNVLFVGGHVSFCTTGNVGVDGDDIYRNQEQRVRAGVKLYDTVLGVAGDRP